jgi:hypothetical protein
LYPCSKIGFGSPKSGALTQHTEQVEFGAWFKLCWRHQIHLMWVMLILPLLCTKQPAVQHMLVLFSSCPGRASARVSSSSPRFAAEQGGVSRRHACNHVRLG